MRPLGQPGRAAVPPVAADTLYEALGCRAPQVTFVLDWEHATTLRAGYRLVTIAWCMLWSALASITAPMVQSGYREAAGDDHFAVTTCLVQGWSA